VKFPVLRSRARLTQRAALGTGVVFENFRQSEAALASLSALRSATPSWLLMFGSRLAKLAHKCSRYGLGVAQVL
jgi:hypothetical protein